MSVRGDGSGSNLSEDGSGSDGLHGDGSRVVESGGRGRGSGSRLVGLDRGTETETISDVVDPTGDSTSIGKRVRSLLVVVGVRDLVAGLLGSILIDRVVTELVGLGRVGDGGLGEDGSSGDLCNGGGRSVSKRSGAGVSGKAVPSISRSGETISTDGTGVGGGNGHGGDDDLER